MNCLYHLMRNVSAAKFKFLKFYISIQTLCLEIWYFHYNIYIQQPFGAGYHKEILPFYGPIKGQWSQIMKVNELLEVTGIIPENWVL